MPKFSDLPTASRLDLDNDYLLINIRNGLNNYQTQKISGNDLIYSTCLPNDITNLFESISTLEDEINNLDSTSAGDSQTLNALVELLNYDGTDSGHLYRIEDLEDAISDLQNSGGGLTEEQTDLLNEITLFQSFTNTTGAHGVGPFIQNYEDLYNQVQNSDGGLTEEQANLLNTLNDSVDDLYLLNQLPDLLRYSSTNGGSLIRIDALEDDIEDLEDAISQMQGGSGLTEEQANLLNQIALFQNFSDDSGNNGIEPFIGNYQILWHAVNEFNAYYSCGVYDFLSDYAYRCNDIDTIQNNLQYLEDGDIEIFKRIAELLHYNPSSGGMIPRIDTLESDLEDLENAIQDDDGIIVRINTLENDLEDLENAIQGGGGLTEEQANLLNQITLFESFSDDTGGTGVGPFIDNYNNLWEEVNEITLFQGFEDCSGDNGIGPFINNYNSLYGLVEVLQGEIGGFYVFEESESHGVGPFISNYNDLWNTVNSLNGGLTEEQTDLLNEITLFQNFSDDTGGTGVGPFIDNYNNLWDVTNNLSNDLYNQVLNNDHPIMTWDTTNTCWTAYDGYREGNAIIGFDPDEVYDYISNDVPIHATFPVFINTPEGVWNTLNGGLVDGGIPT